MQTPSTSLPHHTAGPALQDRLTQRAAEIDAALQQAGRTAADTAYLPLIARKAEAWTVLLDGKTAAIVGYLPLDSF